jgi:ABC-type sugar transport system substrate-binding protein
MVCVGFNPTLGMINVLSEVRANGGKEIKSFGIDIDDTITQAINDGVITARWCRTPRQMGYISMLTLKYMAEG